MNSEALRLIEELKTTASHPAASVRKAMAETGKKAVGCFPIYAPEELIYAAGALPVGMWGGPNTGTRASQYLQSFCCSLMKANTEQVLRGDYDMLSAVILTTYCDTLKCITENWKTAVPERNPIPMVYPQNRKTEAGKLFFIEELTRVQGELERVLQTEITESKLEDAMEVYEDYRAAMRDFTKTAASFPQTFDAVSRHLVIKAGYFQDKKQYTETIRHLLSLLNREEPEPRAGKRIVLTGLLAEPPELLELFTENGLQVAADDLAQESRQFRVSAPEVGTCFSRMAERLAGQDGCAFLYDSQKGRGENLVRMVQEADADAVIYCQLKFCDPDEFDYPLVKDAMEQAGIPMLQLEFEQQMESAEQLRTRVQGFAELLG